MSDTKISALTALAGGSVASGDLFVTVDVSDTTMASSGTDKRLTVSSLGTALTTLALVDAPGAAAAAEAASQPLDADLTSIVALTTTSYGRSLLTLANAAALVSTAGLDADLATFVVPASTTISTFGASLVDDADAATARTTLGLSAAGGDLGGTYPNPTVLTGQVGFTVGSPTVGAGYGINSTGGVATEQAFLGLLFYGTQWNDAATIDLRRINGTQGSPTAILSGDILGGMHIGASIATANSPLQDVSQFYSVATENYGATAQGNRWDFYVNKNNSGVVAGTSKSVAFRIDQDGSIDAGFGTYGAVTSATFTVSNVGAVTAASGTIGAMTVSSAGVVAGITTLDTSNVITMTRLAGSPTIMLRRDDAAAEPANTNVGQISFIGVYNTSHAFVNAAIIAAISEAAFVGPANAATQLRFGTTSASASLVVNRLVMDSAGTHHFTPTITTGLVTTSTLAIKNDGSVWVAPTTYASNQPTAAPVQLNSSGITMTAADIATDTTTGTKIGTATTQKLGFFNATPIIRGTAFTQTYSTATHTHAAVTALAAPAGGTGTAAGGYDTAVNRDLMITAINANRTDIANIKQVVNGLIDDLQALGLIA